MTNKARYLLLTREGCELCEAFEQDLLVHCGALDLQRADVDSKPEWQRRYGLRVPVLLDAWNEVVAEGRFDSSAWPPV